MSGDTTDDWADEAPDEADDADETPGVRARERGEQTGRAIRAAVAGAIGWVLGVLGGLLSTLSRPIPFTGRLFHRLAVKSLENYHKKAGGDAIGIVTQPNGSVSFVPIKHKPPEVCEDGERPGWHAKGVDKVWNAGSEGQTVRYLGKTPIVPLHADDTVEAGWMKPRIAEAIELDQDRPIYTDPTIEAVIDASSGQARTDGGVRRFEITDPGEWLGDAVVDLSSGEGYDGMRISFEKAHEWFSEQTTSETMQMQEERGYIMGLQHGGDGPDLVKIMLIAAAIVLGTLGIVFVLPELLGSNLTSMNPL